VVTATPTPISGVETTVTLQQGSGGYAGSEDTYIHQYDPDKNHCAVDQFRVGYDQTYFGLVRFDVASIPFNAIVTQAKLHLYATGWGGADITMNAHCVKRPVSFCEATWNRARAGQPWGQPGCNDPEADRCTDAAATVTSSGIRKWYQFDLTALVQGWVSGSVANNGVVLRSPGSTSSLWFASAENADPSLRPKLVITYRPVLIPTATATPVATPTMSPTPSATSTATMTPTLVPSVTPTLAPTATETSTATPTVSPTPTPAAEERLADMERRVGILEGLLRAIIDILRRAGRVRR
jgi:hypothetical protein